MWDSSLEISRYVAMCQCHWVGSVHHPTAWGPRPLTLNMEYEDKFKGALKLNDVH